MEEGKIGVADSVSEPAGSMPESEAGDVILSIDDIKKGYDLFAVPSEYGEAIAELEAQGFGRHPSDSEGVVLLCPPGGSAAGYSQSIHTMKVVSHASPTDRYPLCSTGESKDLPPVNLSSGEIKEDTPRKPVAEKVAADIILQPSIVKHGSHAMLRFTIDEFHFGSYDMTDTDEERGYFIHTASIQMSPKWVDPQKAMNVWPATGAPQAVSSKGKAGKVELTIAAAPSFTMGGEASHQLEVSQAAYTFQRQELCTIDPKGMVAWAWQMRTWGDFQPFRESTQDFRQGKVPPLPYPVQQGQHGGVASFTAKVSNDGSRIQASWPVDKKLLDGVVGQFEMEVKVFLRLVIVKSKSFHVRIKETLLPTSRRPHPDVMNASMTAKFAV
ncbi:unnamed protein product [Ectocarpus sp. 12 AP-2014]